MTATSLLANRSTEESKFNLQSTRGDHPLPLADPDGKYALMS
jgi:hypothetical protein